MKEILKRTEDILYHYKELDIKIKNIKIDIENLKNDITIKAVTYKEKTSPTYAFNSAVENDVVYRDEKIKELEAKLKYNEAPKAKVDAALEELSDNDLELIKLRYFSKDKPSWISIGIELGFNKDYCMQMRNKIISKVSEMIYF